MLKNMLHVPVGSLGANFALMLGVSVLIEPMKPLSCTVKCRW